MQDRGFAFFVRLPRTLDDLKVLHPLNRERAYEVAAAVTLEAIDYLEKTLPMILFIIPLLIQFPCLGTIILFHYRREYGTMIL